GRHEVAIDAPKVGAGGRPEALETGARQDSFGAARISAAGRPLDQAIGDETVDQPGHPALAQENLLRQLAHPEPARGGAPDVHQRLVLGQRQAVLLAELVVEPPEQPRVRLEEGPPDVEAGIGGAEAPSGFHGFRHPPHDTRPIVDLATKPVVWLRSQLLAPRPTRLEGTYSKDDLEEPTGPHRR